MDVFPFDIRSYDADAWQLCTFEHGVYFQLLRHYMRTEKPLPDDDGVLAKIAGIAIDEWEKCKARIRAFFVSSGGKLYQKHCERVLHHASPPEPQPALDLPPPTPKKESKHAKRQTHGTRLPRDWQPEPSEIDFCRQLGIDPAAAAAEFRDYWCAVPGHRGLKLDWPATFRNRVRDKASRRGAPAGRPAGASGNGVDRGFTGALFRGIGEGGNGVDRR